jgi:hypothetical protein
VGAVIVLSRSGSGSRQLYPEAYADASFQPTVQLLDG